VSLKKDELRAECVARNIAVKARDTKPTLIEKLVEDETKVVKVQRKLSLVDRVPIVVCYCVIAKIIITLVNERYADAYTWEKAHFLHDYSWQLPAVFGVAYLFMVLVLAPAWKSTLAKQGGSLSAAAERRWKTVMSLWNLFLTMLSITMLLGILLPFIKWNYEAESFQDMVCDKNQNRWQGGMYFWIHIFSLSKFIELFDTVILVARGKKVAFLHYYHHTSVLMYTWIADTCRFSPGWMFAIVNCFVHSVMYDYYKVRSDGQRLTYDRCITQIQIMQMAIGIIVVLLWGYYHYTDPVNCPADNSYYMILATIVLYASYFLLFLSFYIKRYFKTKTKKAEAKKIN
jgi:hypothetical protein